MNQVDQYQKRISFFENSTKAKEQLIQSENERLKLEFELDKLLNSDETKLKTKALKLKAYYTKLCDDEQKAIKRNQTILNDLQRVDAQFQQFESKLERLSNLKKECQIYLRSSYTKWTNENRILQSSQPITVLPSLLPANLNISQSQKNDSFDLNNLLNKYKVKDDMKDDLVIESVLKNLVNSSSIQPKNQQEQNDYINTDSLKIKQILNQSMLTSLVKPSDDSINEQINQNNEFDEQKPNNNNNKFNLTNQSMNLIKEYEREIKRQDMNLIDSTLINNNNNTFALEDKNTLRGFNLTEEDEEENTNSSQARPAQPEGYEMNHRNSLRQELNLKGFFNLLDFIEIEIGRTIHPDNFYRQIEPHYKNKLDIIKLANENMSLDQMDSKSISMVVLDQLPIIIKKNTTSKCLFPQDLLGLSVTDIDEETALNCLKDKKDREILARLFKHLNIIKRFSSIETNYLANVFATSFTQYDHEKAIKILEKIINSFGLLSTPPPERQLNDTNKSLTETSMNQELLLASSSKLKESSVYQDFIMNTSIKSKEIKFSLDTKIYNDADENDDENDEIDALVAPKVKSNINSNNVNMKASNSSTYLLNSLVKSPRGNGAGDFDFDFSQSSASDSNKLKTSASLKKLNDLRSSKDKKLPAHLRNFDSSIDESDDEDSNENTNSFGDDIFKKQNININKTSKKKNSDLDINE